MLTLLLVVLLFLAIVGGFAVSKLIFLVALLLLIALVAGAL